MKALIKAAAGPGSLQWTERPEPVPETGQVLLELVAAGLCHSDLGMVQGAFGAGSDYSPTFPLVLGHEFLGRVVQNGPGSDLPVGARVVGSAHVTCGRCVWCRRGRSMLCEQRQVLGMDVDGVFAERFVVPARNLVVVPPEIPDRLAVLAEPFAVATHAVDVAQLSPADNICVVGPGTVGLLTLGNLRGRQVTVVGRAQDTDQLQRALELGASTTVTNDSEQMRELAGCFDVVFETAGSPAAVHAATQLLGPGGRLVCMGVPSQESQFSSAQLVWNEQRILGSRAYDTSTWESVPERIKAAPELEALVTHEVRLSDYEHAFELVESRQATKVMLTI